MVLMSEKGREEMEVGGDGRWKMEDGEDGENGSEREERYSNGGNSVNTEYGKWSR